MRTAIIIALLLCVAAVRIDTVHYDPLNEAGSEFIAITNSGEEAVNISGWHIATATSATDATLIGSIAAGTTFIVADSGWSTGRDNLSWPEADHEETITLPNTKGFVRLVDSDGNVQDTVGYGETDTYEGSPHAGAEEGMALSRQQDTGDNAADFIAQAPFAGTERSDSSPEHSVGISVEVENAPPTIVSWWLEDDLEREGIQLLPVPGGERRVRLSVNVTDANGNAGLRVEADGEQLTREGNAFQGEVTITAQSTEVIITASDGEHISEERIAVELLGAAGIRISPDISLRAEPGSTRIHEVQLENVGTVPVSLRIKGESPARAGALVGEITYRLSGEEYVLGREFREHAVALPPGQRLSLTVAVSAGKVPAGIYTGRIIVVAIP